MLRTLPVVAVLLATPSLTAAQVVNGELRLPRLERRPVIDGVLGAGEWESAAILDQWVQSEPADNGRPHGPTVAYIGYDSQALYLAIRASDEPGRIRYRLHERDNITSQNQDWIGIQLDPTNARRRAFSLAINPVGVQGDGLNVEGSGYDEWDGIFDTAGRVASDHYVIELAIPFKSLRYPPGRQRWGFTVNRIYGRDGARDYPWPRNRDLGCDLCQMITLTGIEGIGSATALEINPAIVGRTSATRPDPAGPFDPGRTRGEFGANLKYGVTPSLTLDGTWNPDFSQVEADAGQLEINNRFALFFPERRPFFLEGTDIFLTRFPMPGQDASIYTPPINIVYSRRIVDPDAGVKLTGKVGRLSLGLLGAVDAAAEYQLDRGIAGLPAASLDPFRGATARAGVVRAKLDVLGDGYVGMALTGRRFGDGRGVTGTVDTRLRFGPSTVFRFLAATSDAVEPDVFGRIRATVSPRITDPSALSAALDSLPEDVRALDRESRRGSAVQASIEYDDRHWNAGLGVLDITPRFETPLGFTPRTDYALLTGYVAYLWQSTGFFRQIQPRIRFEEGYDHGASDKLGSYGNRTDRIVSSYIDLKLPAATDLSFGYSRSFLRVDGREFPKLDRVFVYLSAHGIRELGWELFARAGEEVIFDDVVDGGPALPSSFVSASVTATARPAPPVRIGLELNAARIWRRTASEQRESRYAESAIPRIRTQIQINRALGIRLIGEYRTERYYSRSGALASKREVARTDALVTYLIHPGQSLQLGWSTLATGDLELPLRTVGRGGMAKLAYLWRF
jgi:hypothetical protein